MTDATAPNVWLMGQIGSGKSHAIRTLVEAVGEVFLIATEPNYADVLGDIPPDKLHWTYIPSYNATLGSLRDAARLLQQMDVEAIKKMPGKNRSNYNQWFQLMDACNNFKDERTGKEYGDVALFTNQQALVIDGLSGMNNMAKRLVAGDKPFMSWPEFEAAQFCVEQFINTIAQSTKCWFVMTSHIEYEPDPVTGTNKLMPSTIGKVLAPRLPTFFSEAIMCRKINDQGKLRWVWDNMTPDCNVKFRNLPPSSNHTPDFAVIKKNWETKTEFLLTQGE